MNNSNILKLFSCLIFIDFLFFPVTKNCMQDDSDDPNVRVEEDEDTNLLQEDFNQLTINPPQEKENIFNIETFTESNPKQIVKAFLNNRFSSNNTLIFSNHKIKFNPNSLNYEVKNLILDGCQDLTFEDCMILGPKFVSLEKLIVLNCPKIKVVGLISLLTNCFELKFLFVANCGTKINDFIIQRIGRACPNLTVLKLDQCNKITNLAFNFLAVNCKQLRSLFLSRGAERKGVDSS